jgi:hypothetical protein
MAYNQKNRLKRIIDIQNLTLSEKEKGYSQEFIYQTIIKPQYLISRATFYSYLGTNAKRQLKQLTNEKKEKSEQGKV